MIKRRIFIILIAMFMVLSLCACQSAEEKAYIEEWEAEEELFAIQEEYGIEFEYILPEEGSKFDLNIKSDGFAELEDSEKLSVFIKILDANFFSALFGDSKCRIVAGEDEYTASCSYYDEQCSLFMNGTDIYYMDNPILREENKSDFSDDEEQLTPQEEWDLYYKDYEYDYSDDNSDVDINTCKSCSREFPAGDSGKNYMNIAKTGMCKNCYNNYKSMSQYAD